MAYRDRYEYGNEGMTGTDWFEENRPPVVDAGPIPTNGDGSQVGGGTPWDNGAPTSAPEGFYWDPEYAMFREIPGYVKPRTGDPNPTPTPTPGPGGGGGAPQIGMPTSGFGAAPPRYASDPNAPQYQPMPTYVPPQWTGGDFVNPTEEELYATPGYQARLNDRMKGLSRQHAAGGTLLNGGTLKALDRAGQDYATGEYQTLRGNRLDEYKQRYSQFQDKAGMDLGARTINANENQNSFMNRTNSYLQGNTRTLSDYITNLNATRNSELDYWNRLNDLNQTGSGLAGGSR